MSKNTVVIAVALTLGLAAGGAIILNKPKPAENTNNTHSTTNTPEPKKDDGGPVDLTDQTTVEMDIKNSEYTKPAIMIKKGTKVTWTNQDSIEHNVFSLDNTGPRSELLKKSEKFSFTFDNATKIHYKCEPHPFMTGLIIIVD